MSEISKMRGDRAPAILDSIRRRPRQLMATLIGVAVLPGCVSESDVYVPVQEDVCTIVSSRVMVLEYEADRWADGMGDRQRLEREIEVTLQETEEGPRYAVCVDPTGQAHATWLERIDNLKRYFGYNDEGFSGAGLISVPALLEQQSFEAQYLTPIDPSHGT